MDRVNPNNFNAFLEELEPLPYNWSRYDAHESYLKNTEDDYHINFQQDDDDVGANNESDDEENDETESDEESKVSPAEKKRKRDIDDNNVDDTPQGLVHKV